MPASTSTLPSGPVRTATFPPEPSSTVILLRSLWVTIGETAALSLMRLTRPRASANAARGVSHPPVAVKAAPPTQHRQNPRRDMMEECFAVIVLSMPLPRGALERRSPRPPVKPSRRPERLFLFRDHEVDESLVDHPFEPLTTRAPEFVSPGSFRPQLAAEEVADQRRHLVELVFEREVAGIEEMEFSLWQVA